MPDTPNPVDVKDLPERLREVVALAEKATSGDWVVSKARKFYHSENMVYVENLDGSQVCDLYNDVGGAHLEPFPNDRANAKLIVALRNSIPDLALAADEIDRLRKALVDEQAGAETLDEVGMYANDKLSKLVALILDLKTGTPYGEKVKSYARFCLGQGLDPLREVRPFEQEGSLSALTPRTGER